MQITVIMFFFSKGNEKAKSLSETPIMSAIEIFEAYTFMQIVNATFNNKHTKILISSS